MAPSDVSSPREAELTKSAPSRRAIELAVAGCVCLSYAGWAAGTRSFSTEAEVAVAIPIALAAVAALVPDRSEPPAPPLRLGLASPAVGVIAGIVALEVAALVLGGRSSAVPSLSTVLDQTFRWHTGGRFLLFSGWLLVAVLPLAGHLGRTRREPPSP